MRSVIALAHRADLPGVVDHDLGLEAVAGRAPFVLTHPATDAARAAGSPRQAARSKRSTKHCARAATHVISSSDGSPSQMRSSTVPKFGCGRMSHHTSRTDSIALDASRMSMYFSNSFQPDSWYGRPRRWAAPRRPSSGTTRGRCPNRSSTATTPTATRSAAGRRAAALTIGIAFSGARTPQCTCTPKICSCRANHWLRSISEW